MAKWDRILKMVMSSKKMIRNFYIRKKVSPDKPFLNQIYITVLALSFFLLLLSLEFVFEINHRPLISTYANLKI